MDDIEDYGESYPYGFEFEEEHVSSYRGELELHFNEAVFSASSSLEICYEKEPSGSDIEQEQLNDLSDTIKRIEQLRLQESILTRRRNNGLNILVELFERGLIMSPVNPLTNNDETPDELNAIYENRLMQFKEAKELWLRRERKLKEEIKSKTEYLELIRQKCSDLVLSQEKSELKAGLEMVHPKTGKKLPRDDIVNMIDTNRKQEKRIGKLCMKHLTENIKCKKIEILIKDLKSSSTFSIEEYQKFTASIRKMDIMEGKSNKIISNVRHSIRSTLKLSSNIPKRMIQLNEIKQNKKNELEKIKDQWRKKIMTKSKKQVVANLRKNYRRLDFTENPLLLKNYEENIKKVKNNQIYEAKLSQDLVKNTSMINRLKKTVEKVGSS